MDLSTLASIYAHPGPFVSIYLDTESAVEDAAVRLEVRWQDVVRDLTNAGVDDATIQALTAARGGHELGGTRVLIASHGVVHLARSLPEKTDTDVVRVSGLPYLLPLVDWAQTRVPHVVVLTDRAGADILAYIDGPEPVESGSVDSGRHPIHKTGIGGWSEHRYQLKVEENWKASAKEVASTVENVAQDVDAQLIIVAGDVHAIDGLRDHLIPPLQEKLVVIDGGRAEDGSADHVAEEVLEALAQRLRDDVEATLADFAKYRGRAASVAELRPATDVQELALNAADGLEHTVEALRKAQVGTLLLAENFDEKTPLFYGPEPVLLATKEGDLEAMGVSTPRMGPAVDVLLRAALATDAQVRLLPAGRPETPTDGVGALLRYSDSSATFATS